MVRRIREEYIDDDPEPVRRVVVQRRVGGYGFGANPVAIAVAVLLVLFLLVLLAGAL